MNEKQNSHSVFVLFIVLSLLVVVSSFSVYKRASNQSPETLSPNLTNTPAVLGEQTSNDELDYKDSTSTNYSDPVEEETSSEDSEDDTSDDNSTDSNSDISDNYSEVDKQLLLEEKAKLISNQVKNGEVDPAVLFSPVLVDFFGEDELQIVFDGVTEVTFENLEMSSEKEGKGNCTLVEKDETTQHTCYFYFQDDQWYLYKTELK